MDPSSETKLRNEIKYLTRLIAAHKAIKSLQSSDSSNSHCKGSTIETGTLSKSFLKNVAAPSWIHTGSISSHLNPSLLSHPANNHSLPPPLLNSIATSLKTTDNSSLHDSHSALIPLSHDDHVTTSTTSHDCHVTYQPTSINVQPAGIKPTDQPIDSNQTTFDISSAPSKLGTKRNLHQSTSSKYDEVNSKRARLTHSHSRSKYVWSAGNDETNKRKNAANHRSKYKWERKEMVGIGGGQDAVSNGVTMVAVSNGVTMVTNAYRTIPVASHVSRKRRRSSGGNSSFIVDKYKMFRVSSSSNKSGFSQRRLNYITKQSNYSPLPRHSKKRCVSFAQPRPLTIKRPVNKVWIATGEKAKKPKKSSGMEVKTKQGNKQWLSSALMEGRAIRRATRRCHQKRPRDVQLLMGDKYYMLSKNKKSLKRRLSTASEQRDNSSIPLVSSQITSINNRKRLLANYAIQKSVNRVWKAKKNYKTGQSKQYCLFYNRFGKCNRGDKCMYVHDPARVAICNKFLRGKCINEDCPFSHNIAKEKMPVCSFFLKGVCNRENCPYLHVNVGNDAELCSDFMKGYCPQGENCNKKHTLTCPDFTKSGSCPRGKHCPLRHWKKKPNPHQNTSTSQAYNPSSISALKIPHPIMKLRNHPINKTLPGNSCNSPTIITPNQLDFIPLDTNEIPEFIAL